MKIGWPELLGALGTVLASSMLVVFEQFRRKLKGLNKQINDAEPDEPTLREYIKDTFRLVAEDRGHLLQIKEDVADIDERLQKVEGDTRRIKGHLGMDPARDGSPDNDPSLPQDDDTP